MEVFTQHRSKLLLVLLAVCLIFLQVSAIGRRSFWEDETVTATLGPLDFGTIVRARAADNHPPLYWLSAAAWGRIFGYSEWSLKAYSLLWLGVVFVLLFELTRLLYGERAALIAVLLLVFSPYVITYGHNARYYAMSAAISLLLAYLVKAYLDHGRWIDLFFYAMAGVALLYTLYMGATILIALNLWYLAAAIRSKTSMRKVLGWLLAQLVVAVCFLPWINILAGVAARNLDQNLALGNPFLELLIRFGYIGYAYLSGEFLSPLNPLVWLLVLVFILVNVFGAIKALEKGWLPLTILVVGLVASVTVNLISVYPQSAWQNLSNRTFFIFPFFVIWLAGLLASLRPRMVAISLGIVLVVYAAGIFNYFTDAQMVKPLLAVPWREMMQTIREQKTPDSMVLCSEGDVACSFYLMRFGLDEPDAPDREIILNQPPQDLWWIQINLGAPNLGVSGPNNIVSRLMKAYRQFSVVNYAPQDPSIRSIKSELFHQVDYEYRVSLYHFFAPVQP